MRQTPPPYHSSHHLADETDAKLAAIRTETQLGRRAGFVNDRPQLFSVRGQFDTIQTA